MKIYKQIASGYIEEVSEGFNFWALFFGPLWFLFKGMIGYAILSVIGSFFAYYIFNLIVSFIFWIIIGATANRLYEDYLIKKGYSLVESKNSKKLLEEKSRWECEKCGKKFIIEKTALEHERRCKR